MILRQLKIKNFGAFEGDHALVFHRQETPKKRNITLIGGKNGAGKTSILEALKLSLYGHHALGLRAPEKRYVDHLRGRINRNVSEKPDVEVSVGIEFDFALDGQMNRFLVRRTWKDRTGSGKLMESLDVFRDGKALDDLERNQWQDFINSLIPPGVLGFFFFNAEQIEKLIDEDSACLELKESVYSLLNLDLLRRLGEDLDSLQSKLIKRTSGVAPRLREINDRGEVLREKIRGQRERLEAEEASVREGESKLKEIEQSLFVEEKSIYQIRGELKQRKVQLEKELARLRQKSADIVGELLPFAAAKKTTASFLKTVEKEREVRRWVEARKLIIGLLPKVAAELEERAGKLPSNWLAATNEAWKRVLDAAGGRGEAPLHDLTDAEIPGIISLIKAAREKAGKELKSIEAQKLKAYEEMRQIARRRNRLDKTAVSQETEEDYKKLTEAAREKRLAIHVLTEQIALMDREAQKLHKEKEDLAVDERGLGEEQKKISLSARVSRVIDVFFERLFIKKLEELSVETTTIYSSLARKKGFVKKIYFSPETMAVHLTDRNGNPVDRKLLSAGEKQMLAVSILWALGRVSGKQLPIVIDTPLARLDSDHRDSFVIDYLPKASHQVVVLSTDTEIDKEYSQKIQKKVAHEYLLQFDEKRGSTKILPGYFFGGVT